MARRRHHASALDHASPTLSTNFPDRQQNRKASMRLRRRRMGPSGLESKLLVWGCSDSLKGVGVHLKRKSLIAALSPSSRFTQTAKALSGLGPTIAAPIASTVIE